MLVSINSLFKVIYVQELAGESAQVKANMTFTVARRSMEYYRKNPKELTDPEPDPQTQIDPDP